ncbi:MAG TPA: 2-dehydropantoate 2-reductase N-terminal domain-containing protein [Hymenobacter sp.]|jgi:ketopantoate reductase
MRVTILGTGAVGTYFGGRLAQAGKEVTFIARGENPAALRAHGLRVASIADDFRLPAVRATDNPAKVCPVEVVLLGVKAGQVAETAPQLRPLLGSYTLVLPLQNGVEGAFRRTSIGVEEPTDLRLALWKKSLFVAPFGTVRAATRVPNGELLAMPESRTLLRTCLTELAASVDVALPADALDQVCSCTSKRPSPGPPPCSVTCRPVGLRNWKPKPGP